MMMADKDNNDNFLPSPYYGGTVAIAVAVAEAGAGAQARDR